MATTDEGPLLDTSGGYKLQCMDVRRAVSCSPPAYAVSGFAPLGRTLVGTVDSHNLGVRLFGRAADVIEKPQRIAPPTDTRRLRIRSAMVVVALMWALVTAGIHGGALSAEHHAAHAAHPLLASLGAEFAVSVEHAHLVDGSAQSHHPEQFAAAVLPRSGTVLVALGLVAAVLAITGVFGGLVVPAGRGPPVGLGAVVTGRDRLTLFCLARR